MEGKDIEEFDDFVKSALDNVEVAYDPSSWDTLQKRWSDAQAIEIDETAREALSGYTVAYEPESWDAMQQKWSAAQAEEIDQTAREAMSNYSVAYEPASWAVLLERLESIEYKRRLVALKILEAAVVLLLLVTIGRFTSPLIHTDQQKESTPQQSDPLEKTTSAQDKQTEMAILSPAIDSEQGADTETQYIRTRVETVPSSSPSNLDVATVTLNQLVEGEEVTGGVFRDNHQVEDEASFLIGEVDEKTTSEDLRESSESLSRLAVSKDAAADQPALHPASDMEQVSSLDALAMRTSILAHEKNRSIEVINLNSLASQVSLLAAEPLSRALQTRVGIYGQASRHYMQSNMPRPNLEKFSQRRDDFGVGFIANVQFGRMGIDLGMGYEKIDFLSGQSLGRNLIQKVHLPIHLRTNIIQGPSYNVYAKAGVAAHGVLYANYHSSGAIARGNSSLNQVKYNDGLLVKGGVKQNNFYMMKSAGLGIDGRLTDDISVFLEGLYQDNLSGSIGGVTTNDQLQMESVVLILGVFYNFDR